MNWTVNTAATTPFNGRGHAATIYSWLQANGAASSSVIAAATGIKETVASSTLSNMKKAGFVVRVSAGRRRSRPFNNGGRRRPRGSYQGYNAGANAGGSTYTPPKPPPPPPPPTPKIKVDDTKAAMLLALQNHIAARHSNKEDVAKTFDRFRAFAAHATSPTANVNEAENAEAMLVKQILDLYRRA
jgi:DNA-binding Lrp family transcriptional regulator